MKARALGAELAALVAVTLWVYGGTAVLVARIGDGQALSFGAAAAVVVLAYGLARLLQQLDLDDVSFRLWGAGLSLVVLYLVLRIEITGEPYLWELGWLGDLLRDPGATLQGRSGDVATVTFLVGAWAYAVMRGGREITYESALAETAVGLGVVFLAAGFASSVDAPQALRWLPAPYMATALVGLSLIHLGPVAEDRRRPFGRVWALWIGGSLVAIAGVAVIATLFDLSWFEVVGHGLVLAAQGIGLAIFFVLSPFIIGVAWLMELFVGWIVSGDEFTPEPTDTSGITEQAEERAEETSDWQRALAYVVRSGVVVLLVAVVVVVLLVVFQRMRRRKTDELETREAIEIDVGGPIGDLRSLFTGALGRLRGRARFGHDAIGRLYGAMLARAEAQGLARPPAVTPNEFAPRLEAHFASPLPGVISRAYVEARYGARPPPADELQRLRDGWREVEGAR